MDKKIRIAITCDAEFKAKLKYYLAKFELGSESEFIRGLIEREFESKMYFNNEWSRVFKKYTRFVESHKK